MREPLIAIVAVILSVIGVVLKKEIREDQAPRHNAQVIETKLVANDKQFRELKDAFEDLDRRHTKKLEELEAKIDALRWDVDDIRIQIRPKEEIEAADKLAHGEPESVVVVSDDYPKWRLPYGVKIKDQRPPELVAEKIEKMKAGEKGIVYMWLSFDQPDGREKRVYMTEVTWKDPKKIADKEPVQEPAGGPDGPGR